MLQALLMLVNRVSFVTNSNSQFIVMFLTRFSISIRPVPEKYRFILRLGMNWSKDQLNQVENLIAYITTYILRPGNFLRILRCIAVTISNSKFWRSIKFNEIRKSDEKAHQLLYKDLFQRFGYLASLKLFIKNKWLLQQNVI